MDVVALLGVLVAGVVVLTPVADRIGVPQPILLTLFGLALGAVPGVGAPNLPPELILPLVLPPLLFAATQTSSGRELRDAARPILGLAIGLTLATVGAVAVAGHALGLPWTIAVVLGAIVAPPDPVAASAVAAKLRLPQRLVTVLEGEGQFNDAAALVVYQLGLTALTAGTLSLARVGIGLVVAVGGGTVIGTAGGLLARYAIRHLHEPAAETAVTVAMPFALYLGADRIGASGVLAVLICGFLLRSTSSREMSSAGYLLGRSVWSFVEFVVSGLLFAFLGLQLTGILGHSALLQDGATLRLAGVVVAVLVVLRAAAMFGSAALAGRRARRQGGATPYGWREAIIASWAGMRGVVTVATALALPMTMAGGGTLAARQPVLLVSLLVVGVTLVVQGLTLAPLIRWLGVAAEGDARVDVRRLHRIATEAAIERLQRTDDEVPDAIRKAVLLQYESRLGYRQRVVDLVDGGEGGDGADDQLRRLLARATEAERDAVLQARRRGDVSPSAADDVLFDVEARALRYDG